MRDLVPTSPLTYPLYTVYTVYSRASLLTKCFHSQREDGHCQVPKHEVVFYVVNSTHIFTIQ